jgi:hypothetical protein
VSRSDIELALHHLGVHPTELEDTADLVERLLADDAFAERLNAAVDYDCRVVLRANLAEGQRQRWTRLRARKSTSPGPLELGLRAAIANTPRGGT